MRDRCPHAPWARIGPGRRCGPGRHEPGRRGLDTVDTMSARVALALAGVATLALTACGDSPVEAKPAALASTSECAAVAKAWPKTVAGLDSYPNSADSPSVHAWGESADDALIARCGVTSPGPTSDACFSANDVDWVQIPISGGKRYVTYGRAPAIEVLVPASAKLDGTALAAFAPAAKKIAQGPHRCS